MKKKLFGYAILFHDTINEPGKIAVINTTMLVAPVEVLATSTKEAYTIAAMNVPKEYESKMEFVEVIIWAVVSAGIA